MNPLYNYSYMDTKSQNSITRLHEYFIIFHFPQMTSKELTNKLYVDSLNFTVWEEEVVFWSKYAKDNLNKIKVKLKSFPPEEQRQSQPNSFNLISRLFNSPLSVVTTVECSDWSIQLHSDMPSLQAKEPLCRVVMATCVGNVQWDSPEDKSTTIKYVHVSM